MKVYVFSFLVAVMLLSFCAAGFCQERITITTYYPAPYGVYVTLRALNGTSSVALNVNAGQPNIVMGGGGSQPYIEFNRTVSALGVGTSNDFRIRLNSASILDILGNAARPQLRIRNSTTLTQYGQVYANGFYICN